MMKFKKLLIMLGALMIVSSPIATSISCGANLNNKVNSNYSAQRATNNGYSIAITNSFHTYSKQKPFLTQEFKFKIIGINSTVIELYKIKKDQITFSEKLNDKIVTDASGIQSKTQDGEMILNDLNGTCYIQAPLSVDGMKIIIEWINRNKIIQDGGTAAISRISFSLKATGYKCTNVNIINNKVKTITLSQSISMY